VFSFAWEKFMIDVNPMERVRVPPKVDTGIIDYTPEQVRLIVSEARKLRIELFLIVLLQSLTGARISEIADRNKADIREFEGALCLDIVKGKTLSSKRIIPLHPEVIRHLQPYMDIVPDGGLLFPELPRGNTDTPTAYASRFLAQWIRRDLGIRDENIEPNHSMRHYVKSRLLKAKVDVKIRDMICGHGKNIARKYEHADIEQMSEAIALLPNRLASAQYCSITTS